MIPTAGTVPASAAALSLHTWQAVSEDDFIIIDVERSSYSYPRTLYDLPSSVLTVIYAPDAAYCSLDSNANQCLRNCQCCDAEDEANCAAGIGGGSPDGILGAKVA